MDTRRNSMVVPMDVRVAVGIRHDRTAADPMGDRVAGAAVLRLADPAVEEAAGIAVAVVAAVVVHAEAEVVVALRIRLRHAVVAAEGPTGKIPRASPA